MKGDTILEPIETVWCPDCLCKVVKAELEAHTCASPMESSIPEDEEETEDE